VRKIDPRAPNAYIWFLFWAAPKFSVAKRIASTGRTVMVKEEILSKLRSAEEETAKRIAKAKEQAAEILKSARREADERIARAESDARSGQEAKLADERKRLEKERDRILAEGAKKEEALRASYAKKVGQHVEKAIDLFERSA
jgi:vacuolar-type H+-ATPase subunit H